MTGCHVEYFLTLDKKRAYERPTVNSLERTYYQVFPSLHRRAEGLPHFLVTNPVLGSRFIENQVNLFSSPLPPIHT